MPPFLSNIFGSDQSSQLTEARAEQGLELSPEITLTTGGEYEGADGTVHTYSNETTIGADVSTQLVIDAASEFDQASG